MVTARCERSFEHIESMPFALRECVHEYGYAIVKACLQAGVSNPAHIHQLVREIWEGARQPGQRRPRMGMMDWLLLQAGVEIPGDTFLRVLENENLVIVPRCPTFEMLQASMAEVSDFTVRCTKAEKHKRRLFAAIEIGSKFMFRRLKHSPAPAKHTEAA